VRLITSKHGGGQLILEHGIEAWEKELLHGEEEL
jgi:hypothetical protein